MSSNLEIFKADIEKLIKDGFNLSLSMRREIAGEQQFEATLEKQIGKEKAKAVLQNLPVFSSAYERWYSESLSLVKQLLPDRVNDFKSFYEKPKSRKDISYGNYVMQDYLQGLRVTLYGETKVDTSAAMPQFEQQLNIVKAAKARFESSLFDIKQIIQADLFDSEIDAARMLLRNKFLRAAGAIAGVVIERHLLQICSDHNLKITKKNPGISDLSEALKSHSIIDVPQWRNISFLADIRNMCSHSKVDEPTEDQVRDLVNGASKILKTVF